VTDEDECVYVQGLSLSPLDVDGEGKWFSEEDGFGGDIADLCWHIPDHIEGGPYPMQEVMAIVPAREMYLHCRHCEAAIPEDGLVVILEQFNVYLAKCCRLLVWNRKEEENNE